MGSHDFEVTVRAGTPEKAYRKAVDDATYEHGHNAYNGTISTTTDWHLIDMKKIHRMRVEIGKDLPDRMGRFMSTDKFEQTVDHVIGACYNGEEDVFESVRAITGEELFYLMKWDVCMCYRVKAGVYHFFGMAAC